MPTQEEDINAINAYTNKPPRVSTLRTMFPAAIVNDQSAADGGATTDGGPTAGAALFVNLNCSAHWAYLDLCKRNQPTNPPTRNRMTLRKHPQCARPCPTLSGCF